MVIIGEEKMINLFNILVGHRVSTPSDVLHYDNVLPYLYTASSKGANNDELSEAVKALYWGDPSGADWAFEHLPGMVDSDVLFSPHVSAICDSMDYVNTLFVLYVVAVNATDSLKSVISELFWGDTMTLDSIHLTY